MLVQDKVHGTIEIPEFIEEIINHPQFQRLKNLKQLAFLSTAIYPSANHTRYDHCIGTYKSAQDHLNALERNSNYKPELPDWCRKAVEIAALLHDVGHGPFSHNWQRICRGSFDHEQNGLLCVDQIFSDVKSPELISQRDDNNGRGLQLIKALILGKSEMLTFPMMGLGYIFDIVHNKRCGLDVDKWDYLRRDHVRLRCLSDEELQFDGIFLNARISPDGQCIEYRYEDYHLIYKLFVARWRLYMVAYAQPLNVAFDRLLIKIVQRHRPYLVGIGGDSVEWLSFDDEKLLQLIENDPLTVYLRSPDRWIQTDSGEDSDNYVFVDIKKTGPGVDMKPDNHFALYGDVRLKSKIDRDTETTFITGWFKLE